VVIKNPRTSSASGFTLVELMIVVAMIAVLVTITVTVSLSFRKLADRTSAMNAMRQIQMANISYATEHKGSFVPPVVTQENADGEPTGVEWHENPDFISQLKGPEATFGGGGTPDLSLPISLMDRAVVRKKSANNTNLDDCFGYTAPSDGAPFRQAQLSNPADSAAFITCEEPFVNYTTQDEIDYRHKEKALVVYYDGRAAIISQADVDLINGNGGASNVFWNASGGSVSP
jgi:prepilin-type N-terminal cleavage/methylation domain-containing protein